MAFGTPGQPLVSPIEPPVSEAETSEGTIWENHDELHKIIGRAEGPTACAARRVRADRCRIAWRAALRTRAGADQDRLQRVADRRACLVGQGAPDVQANLGEEINAKGGLLGRPVKLVYYDDQTNAATLPAIYAKLLDIDKVDLLMGHATNLIVAAMPLIIERKKLVMVLLALGSNAEFKYSRYFQSAPFGPDSKGVLSHNFFEVAKTIKPEPKTVALVGADAEFSNNVLIGARENAKKYNLRIVYDRSYPPATVDFSPIVRAIQATNPDVVLLASYPPDSVGIVRAATEIGLKGTAVRRSDGRLPSTPRS